MSIGESSDPRQPKVVVIGGANIDVKARSTLRATSHTSNPGTTSTSPGGVARNIAENVARLGNRVELISVIGRDPLGDTLLEHTRAAGVGVGHIVRTGQPTGTYTAILDSDGELIVAIADMAAISELTPSHLETVSELFDSASLVVLDGNLRPDTFSAAVTLADGTPVIVEPVSVPKVHPLRECIGEGIFAITPGRDELAALTGKPTQTEQEVKSAADVLHDRGVDCVWVSLGSRGSLLSTPDGDVDVTAIPADVVDVTGAGDAMLAAFCHALLAGTSPTEAVEFGHAAAAVTIASPHTVRPDLSVSLLHSTLSQKGIQ